MVKKTGKRKATQKATKQKQKPKAKSRVAREVKDSFTQTQVVPKTTVLLAELNEDLVDKHLLSFFEKLASEPLDADSTASKLAR